MADGELYHRTACAVFRKTHEEYGGLSNMAGGYPLRVNDVMIRTSEALYQACRYPRLPEVQTLIIAQGSPMSAKMMGKPHRAQCREDWNYVRMRIMRWCLRVKLAQNWQTFQELLLSTGDRPIVEESSRDDFWGAKPGPDDTLIGENALGRLLMELREDLGQANAEALKRVEPVRIGDFSLCGQAIEPVEGYQMPDVPLVDPDLTPRAGALWRIVERD
jgi:ribA/ribD-fused uncharacterized protein